MSDEEERHSAHHAQKEHGLLESVGREKEISPLFYFAIAALVLLLGFNQLQISSISGQLAVIAAVPATPLSPQTGAAAQSPQSASLQSIADKVIPKGIPEVYGKELGVSYDDPVKSLTILGRLDGDLYPDGKLKFSQLDSKAQQRYVSMGQMIACEYCCGATELVFKNGQPACGCQHSAAMRGLAKYLLINRPDMADAQILEEMGKWKILFFPQPMLTKAVSFASAGKDLNTIDLTSNKYRGFQAPASSAQGAPIAGETEAEMNARMHPDQVQGIANAPNMVGGC